MAITPNRTGTLRSTVLLNRTSDTSAETVKNGVSWWLNVTNANTMTRPTITAACWRRESPDPPGSSLVASA